MLPGGSSVLAGRSKGALTGPPRFALPAAGQSMASPAGTGYGGLVTRGQAARAAAGGPYSMPPSTTARGLSGRTAAATRSVTGSATSAASGYSGLATNFLNQPAGTGYGGLVTRGQVMQTALRNNKGVSMPPPTTARPLAAGAGAGAIDTAVKAAPNPVAPAKAAGEAIGKKGRMRGGKGLLIGAGAAVIAGLAYSGRRGEGSSGGRAGAYRY